MDHEIASSVASTTGDAHSEPESTIPEKRQYVLPPSRARPACCTHASWCKIRSNRNDRNCCDHTHTCHNHQGTSRTPHIHSHRTPVKVTKTVKNDEPRAPRQWKKKRISKKNQEKNERFHAKKMASHAAISVAYRSLKKEMKKEKKSHKKTRQLLRQERSRRRRAEARLDGRKRPIATSSSSSSSSSDESDNMEEFLYLPKSGKD